MTISYPLTMPTNPSIKSIRFTQKSIVASSRSQFTGGESRYLHQGGWLEAEITLPHMRNEHARDWIGFFAALKGKYGSFWLQDPDYTRRGVGTGSPLVNGANQTGYTLITDGWTNNITNIMRRGDYIQIGDFLYTVTADVNSDGSGNATLDIWPALRESPADNAVITVNNPKGKFRLATNESSWSTDQMKIFGITFACVEDLS